MNTHNRSSSPRPAARLTWWQAALIFAVTNGANALAVGGDGDRALYNSLRRPAVAPPDWLFGPTWLTLNVTSLVALSRIANAPELSARHQEFVAVDGVNWGVLAAFCAMNFTLRSPALGAANTVIEGVLTARNLATAAGLNHRAAWLILPRMLWLTLASYVSVRIALDNADPFLDRLGRRRGLPVSKVRIRP